MDQCNHPKNKYEFSDARLTAIVQTASDSIIISDEHSNIVFANKKTYEIFRYPEGSLIGSDIGVLMPEEYRQGHKAGIQRFIATGIPKLIGSTVEIEGLRKDGTIFPLELSLSSWKEEDKYFFSGIIRDNTEKKQANLILQNQQEELSAVNEELKAAEEELRTINDDLEDRVEKRTKELAESERRVKRGEEELRLITDAVPAMISYVKKDGTYGFVNKAYEEEFQLNKKDIIGKPVKEIIGEKRYNNALPMIKKALSGEFVESEVFQDFGPEVGKKWRRVSFVPHQVRGKTIGTYVLVEDVTKLKNIQIEQEIAYQKLKEKDDFYKALIKHGSDFITVFDEKLNYLYSGGAILRELGYKPEQLIGENAFNFVHPDDILKVKDSLSEVLASKKIINLAEFRFKNARGEWRWLEATVSNQLNNPAVKGVVVSSRDITERINDKLMLQESEQKFKSLFEHHIDMIFFTNRDGVINDVNAATHSYFEVQKQNLVNRRFSDFFPLETAPYLDQAFQKALNGESVRLEIDIPFEGKGICTFDIEKIPVIVNGETIGVYNIFKDVTEISQSNKIIRQQAEKLNTIFESITDAFFTLDKNWNFTYINSEFERLLNIRREDIAGRNIWSTFSEAVNTEFYRQYHNAVNTGKAVHFEAYYEPLEMWLHVKAFPSKEGLSVYFEDVTEQIKTKQELEKLSFVASKTTNGVVIINNEWVIEWVNQGFTRLTGYTLSEVIGKKPMALLQGKETDEATAQLLEENLRQGKPFTGEILNYKKSGEKVWILLDITPVVDEVGKVIKFTSIQTDITESKEAEENQLQMTNDLFRQNRDLQQFTYIVSHNLRSPVVNMIGLTNLLTTIKDRGSEKYEASLKYLKKSTIQLDTVLKDLNQILSIRDKKGAFKKKKVELVPVIQQVLTTLQEPLNECGGKILMDIEAGVSVSGVESYIYSIFHNLLSNSIKYRSPDRQLEVHIRCFDIADKGTVISFSDNGIGFDLEKAGDNIFKLYKKFHFNFKGRGIGLFLVKSHVEAMDGHIEVNSRPNAGTTFRINLK